ncbi:MAG: hypothetical protein ACRCZA_06425, partial [Shewanella sp.]|uniref:hypothetical protein n=1 Tax=Shewanella sp. TaxID=50422 RepID=UPI003F3C788A
CGSFFYVMFFIDKSVNKVRFSRGMSQNCGKKKTVLPDMASTELSHRLIFTLSNTVNVAKRHKNDKCHFYDAFDFIKRLLVFIKRLLVARLISTPLLSTPATL